MWHAIWNCVGNNVANTEPRRPRNPPRPPRFSGPFFCEENRPRATVSLSPNDDFTFRKTIDFYSFENPVPIFFSKKKRGLAPQASKTLGELGHFIFHFEKGSCHFFEIKNLATFCWFSKMKKHRPGGGFTSPKSIVFFTWKKPPPHLGERFSK